MYKMYKFLMNIEHLYFFAKTDTHKVLHVKSHDTSLKSGCIRKERNNVFKTFNKGAAYMSCLFVLQPTVHSMYSPSVVVVGLGSCLCPPWVARGHLHSPPTYKSKQIKIRLQAPDIRPNVKKRSSGGQKAIFF